MLASYLFVATVIVTLAFRCETTFAENDLPVRDMVRIVGDVTVEEGQVVKDAVAIVGSVTVLSGGRVMGNAVAIGGDVHLKANARVEGDTVSIGGEILKEEGASVSGNDAAIGSVAKHLVPAFGKWRQIISSTIRQSALKSGGLGGWEHGRDFALAHPHYRESAGNRAGPCPCRCCCGGGGAGMCPLRAIRGGERCLSQRRILDETIPCRDAHPCGHCSGASRG
jgi:hypothetical protein